MIKLCYEEQDYIANKLCEGRSEKEILNICEERGISKHLAIDFIKEFKAKNPQLLYCPDDNKEQQDEEIILNVNVRVNMTEARRMMALLLDMFPENLNDVPEDVLALAAIANGYARTYDGYTKTEHNQNVLSYVK